MGLVLSVVSACQLASFRFSDSWLFVSIRTCVPSFGPYCSGLALPVFLHKNLPSLVQSISLWSSSGLGLPASFHQNLPSLVQSILLGSSSGLALPASFHQNLPSLVQSILLGSSSGLALPASFHPNPFPLIHHYCLGQMLSVHLHSNTPSFRVRVICIEMSVPVSTCIPQFNST